MSAADTIIAIGAEGNERPLLVAKFDSKAEELSAEVLQFGDEREDWHARVLRSYHLLGEILMAHRAEES